MIHKINNRDDQYNAGYLFVRAAESTDKGELHHALNYLKQAFQYGRAPEHAYAFIDLFRNFRERELWREAEESLLEALRVDPENEKAILFLKELHSDAGRFYNIKPHDSAEKIMRHKERTVISKIPLVQMFIEITNMCNGKCITCLNRTMKRKRGVMDFKLFKKIVNESCRNMYLEMVHLYGVGEDYLVPNIRDYFDYAIRKYSERGIKTVLITNGELITDLPKGLSVVDISFNGGTKDSYEKITGINFKTTLNNIWRLEREGQLDGSRNIHMLVFDENKNEVDDFKKLFAYTGANLVMAYKYDNQCGSITDQTIRDFRSERRIPCHYVRKVINIAWNGDIILCPHDFDGSVNYGNVKESSITDIWYGRLHREMMKKHAHCMFEGICRKCNFNVPIEGKNVIVSREERIALRKKHLDYALSHMVVCGRSEACPFVKRYRDNMEELERRSDEPLIRICSDDYRFYGVEALMDKKGHSKCPELKKLKKKNENMKICWEAPTFGPSGYAFAARGYMTGLADIGVRVRTQPIWGDCKLEFEDEEDNG